MACTMYDDDAAMAKVCHHCCTFLFPGETEEGKEGFSIAPCQLHTKKLNGEASRKSEVAPASIAFLPILDHSVSLFLGKEVSLK